MQHRDLPEFLLAWLLIFASLTCLVLAVPMFNMKMVDVQTDPNNNGKLSTGPELHLRAQQYRNGILISDSYHPMSLTDVGGKDWIADKLFNSAGTNITKYAMYIGLSNDATAFNASWTSLPAEITANNMSRALAVWADTGTGTGTLSYTFTASGAQSTRLYGLYYDTYALAPTSDLVAAEQQDPVVKILISGDTLAITITVTIS